MKKMKYEEIDNNYYENETIKISLLLGSLITSIIFFISPQQIHLYLLNIVLGLFGLQISGVSCYRYMNIILFILSLLFIITNIYFMIVDYHYEYTSYVCWYWMR